MPLYVTHYQEYPIFESAEGGYYYTGREVVNSVRVPTLAKGIEKCQKIAREWGFEQCGERCWIDPAGREYIGEGTFVCIESRQGAESSGWHPYQ